MDSNTLVNTVGWYGKGNIGDEAYKLAIPQLFPQHRFEFSDTPKASADGYMLGGGDILAPTFLSALKEIQGKKTVFSTTVSPIVTRRELESFNNIYVRDEVSLQRVLDLDLDAKFLPDAAFILEGDKERGSRLLDEIFQKNHAERYSSVVGVVINSHLCPKHDSLASEYSRFQSFCYQMANVIDNTPASFVFLPFGSRSPWDDRWSNSAVASLCKWHKKNTVVYKHFGVQEMLDIIAALDVMISSRLHGSIFSIAAGTPLIDLTSSHKNEYLLRTLSYQQCSMPYSMFCRTEMVHKLSHALHENESIRQEVEHIANEQRNLLRDGVSNVCIV